MTFRSCCPSGLSAQSTDCPFCLVPVMVTCSYTPGRGMDPSRVHGLCTQQVPRLWASDLMKPGRADDPRAGGRTL